MSLAFLIHASVGLLAALILERCLMLLVPARISYWRHLLLTLLFLFSIILPSWIGDENPILLFPFFVLLFLLSAPGPLLLRLVTAFLFYTLILGFNMLLDTLYQKHFSLEYRMNLSINLYNFLKPFLAYALYLFIKRTAPENGLRLPKPLLLLTGGLTLTPLAALLSYSLWGYAFIREIDSDQYQQILIRLAFTVLPFVLASAVLLLVTAVILTRHEALVEKSRLAQLQDLYYADLKKEQAQLRTLRHDLTNHCNGLRGLLEQGKTEDALSYLDTLTGSAGLFTHQSFTGNEIVNIVLNSKVSLMKAKELEADFSVSLPPHLPISSPDLCSLLGNALDNAISGAHKANDPVIHLSLKADQGLFSMQVINAIAGRPLPDFQTTKAQKEFHGLGLDVMREIARKYHGVLDLSVSLNTFTLIVCFPIDCD